MTEDLGVSPTGPGHSDEPASSLAAVAGSVPNAGEGWLWRFDPFSLSAGDTVYLDRGRYGNSVLSSGRVVRVTPSGQVVLRRGDVELRLTRRGDVVGSQGWARERAISRETAMELHQAQRDKRLWLEIHRAADVVSTAERRQDADALEASFAELAQAIEAQRAETGTGSVHESAVGNADAPNQEPSK